MKKQVFRRMDFFSKNEKSQLLLIAGITICVLIIVSSAATVSMVGTFIPIDKSLSIKTEYENVKEKYGLALQDHLEGRLQTADVNYWFNITKSLFSYAEARHHYFFDAQLVGLTSISADNDGLIVIITLSNENDFISEEVEYYIG